MARAESLSGFAILDTPVTGRVRVRSWHHRHGPTSFPTGAHADIEVAWVLEGRAIYRIAGCDLIVAAGQGIVVPARVAHATRIDPGTRAGSAWLAPELVSEVAASLGRPLSGEPTLIADARRIAALGALLHAEAAEADAGHMLSVEALAESLVVTVLRALPASSRAALVDPRLDAALALLETRYAEPLGVDDLARAAGLSRFHFSRMFRDSVGMSPYQYLQRIRIARARELLQAGHGVTDAALSVGYRDLGRFARAFREQMGVAPSQVVSRRERRRTG